MHSRGWLDKESLADAMSKVVEIHTGAKTTSQGLIPLISNAYAKSLTHHPFPSPIFLPVQTPLCSHYYPCYSYSSLHLLIVSMP